MMTFTEAVAKKNNNYEGLTLEALHEGYGVSDSVKKYASDVSEGYKQEIQRRMTVGQQLSLDLGPNTLTSAKKEVKDLSFDISEESLYTLALKSGLTKYCTQTINAKALKDDFLAGTLDASLASHVVVTIQESFKIVSKKKTVKKTTKKTTKKTASTKGDE